MPVPGKAALLERELEKDALRAAFTRARGGEGTLILVEGSAGAGKTELSHEARLAAERARLTPLEGKGSELEQPFAFGVVRQLLEPAVLLRKQDGLFTGAAAHAARLFEVDERSSIDGDAGFEALHSLYWLVVNLVDEAPLLLSVDDCQWADRESLRFFSYLAQRIEDLPIALVLAGRPPESNEEGSGALWAQFASRPSTVALLPQPLSEPAVAELTREQLGADAAEEFCRACHVATGGNPLFVRELLTALRAAGVTPSATAADEVQAVGPAAVSRFVLHRLATLGPAASELARTVAVLGDKCELQLASRVSGLSAEASHAAADDLVRADIFARGVHLGYVHPIVRAALYEDLGPGEREARHAAAAAALAADDAAAERVTAHLLLTDPTGDARRVTILRTAAASAARHGAPGAAADPAAPGARGAARAARAGGDPGGPRQERGRRGELRGRRGASPRGAGLRCRGDAARRGGDGARAVRHARGRLLRPRRRWRRWARSPTSWSLLDPERSLVVRAELLILATIVPSVRHALPEQRRRFRDLARGDGGYEAVARLHDARERQIRGESAADVASEVEQALAAGLPASAGRNSVVMALIILRFAERYDLAHRMLDMGLEVSRAEGHATRQGIIYALRATIALERGSLRDAQVDAETGLQLVEEPHFSVGQLLAVLITVHVERGELDVADELARRGDASGVTEDRMFLDEYLIARARLRIAQGDAARGAADLQWCGERLKALGLEWQTHWRAVAAPALASLGEKDAAVRLADEQLALARRVGSPRALGLSLRARALIDDGDRRLGGLEEAVAVLEPSAGRLELARTLADLGAELGRANRRREGREASRRAMQLAGECGATALAERARADLQSGPGRRAPVELTGPGALTAAEWRVCRQVAEGHTNREVAQAVFITEKTVERHLSSIFQKLGIRSRHQLREAIGEQKQ